MANDNAPSAREVSRALAALRGLEAPDERIKFEVAKQRWNWAAEAIGVVYHSAASTRQQVIVAGQVAAQWQRYWSKYLPRGKGSRTRWLDLWLQTDERVERLMAMEASNATV